MQELIAPRDVIFYGADWESEGWKRIGARNEDMLEAVYKRTGIDRAVLKDPGELRNQSVAARMSWASQRQNYPNGG